MKTKFRVIPALFMAVYTIVLESVYYAYHKERFIRGITKVVK